MSADPPVTRADCINGPRPCPHTSCRYHTQHEQRSKFYSGKYPREPSTTDTCALDIADRGADMTLDEVGAVLGLTRERVRQIEAAGLRKLRVLGGDVRALRRDDGPGVTDPLRRVK